MVSLEERLAMRLEARSDIGNGVKQTLGDKQGGQWGRDE